MRPKATFSLDPAAACRCGTAPGMFDRRRFLAVGLGAIGAMFSAGPPARPGLAASGQYEAMVVSCIDPRLVDSVHDYMAGRGLKKQYSQFVVAGGPIGVIATAFKDWQKTFADNLAASIDLHHIKKIVAITHRDCGAAKIAYGDAAVATPGTETETHREAHAAFRKYIAATQPSLAVEDGIMALDGSVEMLSF